MNQRMLAGALALVAALGCSKTSSPEAGAARGVGEGTFTVTVQNGQAGNTALRIEGGRVFSADLQINCGVDADGTRLEACSRDFALGTAVVLHATATALDTSSTPARPFTFLGWAGDCSGEGVCRLTGNADKYVVASFAAERTSHPNYSSPSVHGPAWFAHAAEAPGALDCRSCHGAELQGVGIAVSCSACHAWPRPVGPPLTWDDGAWDEAVWQ